MQINEKTLEKILRLYSNLEVPFFQRDYTWGKNEITKLLDDVIKNINDKYFLGTLIIKESQDNLKIIIDGQQRLTTIWLILKAIYQLLQDKLTGGGELSVDEKQISTDIAKYIEYFTFKTSNYKNGETLLKLITSDESTIVEEDNIYWNNFKFIKSYLIKSSLNLVTIYNTLFKIIFTLLSLDGSYDEHLIYSQINSTGKKLTAFDLVKNSLFSKLYTQLNSSNKESEFNKLLDIFNNLFYGTIQDDILKRFLSYKLAKFFPNKSNEIYDEFTALINNEYQDNIRGLYDQLCRYTFIDNFLTTNYTKYNFTFNNSLEFLKEYFGSLAPLMTDIFMTILDEQNIDFMHDKIIISLEKINLISQALLLLENYIIRRFFDGLSSKNNNRFISSQLLPWIRKNLNEDKSNYADLIYTYIYVNANNSSLFDGGELPSYRMPTDEEFNRDISNTEIYKVNSKFCWNFLVRYSKIFNNEQRDFSKYTVEHMMPQDLSVWENAGTKISNELHAKYLHTIGNLTLTPNNSKYSNSLFVDKQKMMRESEAFVINNDFLYLEKWDIDEIKKRTEKILDVVNKNWPLNIYKFLANTTPITTKQTISTNDIKYSKTHEIANDYLDATKIKNLSLLRKSKVLSLNQMKELLSEYLIENKSLTYLEEKFLNLFNAKGWAGKVIIDFLGIKDLKGNLNSNEFEQYFIDNEVKINNLLSLMNKKS